MMLCQRNVFRLLALGLVFWLGETVRAGDSLSILPARITLSGPKARQLLVVEMLRNGRNVGQATDGVTFGSSDPKIVKVEDGRAVPVGDGDATITATRGDQTATAEVTVARQKEPFEWSFRNHVGAVLSKAGCNSGACHGAAAGKNGFKLTLFGHGVVAE